MHDKLRVSQFVFSQIVNEANERNKINNGAHAVNYYGVNWSAKQIELEYFERNQDIALSVIYSKSGCPGLANYHQILEVLSLLFRRRGLWAFLFIKMVSFMRLEGNSCFIAKYMFHFGVAIGIPLDMEDVSILWGNGQCEEQQSRRDLIILEREFFETIEEIQGIIGWNEFTHSVEIIGFHYSMKFGSRIDIYSWHFIDESNLNTKPLGAVHIGDPISDQSVMRGTLSTAPRTRLKIDV